MLNRLLIIFGCAFFVSCLHQAFAQSPVEFTYVYDELGRLTEMNEVNSVCEDRYIAHYSYDEVGNRTNVYAGDECEPQYPTGGNNPPYAQQDFDSMPTYQLTTVDVLANDTDLDGDDLFVTAVTQPWNGNAMIGLNGESVIVYGTATGLGIFSYTVSDGNGGSDVGQVNILVTGDSGEIPPT